MREAFFDDPEVLAMLARKERKALEASIRDIQLIPGDKGDSPTKEELLALIEPLIPPPEKGDDGHTPTSAELRALIRPLIPKVKDGKTPTEEQLRDLILPLIPPPKQGDPGIPGKDAEFDEEELFKRFIDKIKKGQLLDISNIRNASTFMKDGIRYKIEELMHGAGTSGTTTTINTVTQYNLSTKTQVGSNVVIPLSQLTNFATLATIVTVYRNQVPQTEGITFTATATDITVLGASTNNTFSITYTYTS